MDIIRFDEEIQFLLNKFTSINQDLILLIAGYASNIMDERNVCLKYLSKYRENNNDTHYVDLLLESSSYHILTKTIFFQNLQVRNQSYFCDELLSFPWHELSPEEDVILKVYDFYGRVWPVPERIVFIHFEFGKWFPATFNGLICRISCSPNFIQSLKK